MNFFMEEKKLTLKLRKKVEENYKRKVNRFLNGSYPRSEFLDQEIRYNEKFEEMGRRKTNKQIKS